MTEPVVITEGLTRRFGEFIAVDHVSFQVNPVCLTEVQAGVIST